LFRPDIVKISLDSDTAMLLGDIAAGGVVAERLPQRLAAPG
jgi:hypothetical protein